MTGRSGEGLPTWFEPGSKKLRLDLVLEAAPSYLNKYYILQERANCILIDTDQDMIGATMVDWVDEQDQPFAVIPRAEVFGLKAGFRVVHVFIFDKNGALLLQKLSLTRERYPSRWGSAVAGYVAAGEDYRQAAYRRLAAELDVRDCALAGIGKTLMLDQGCRKFIMLYAALHDGPFVIDREHISAVQFLSPHGIAAMLKEHPAYVTPTFRHLWSFYTRTRNQG